MATDRYLKIILTIIAIELLWIGVKSTAPVVSAQTAATPVVIKGVEIDGGGQYLPVAVVGSYRQIPPGSNKTIQAFTTRVDGIAMVPADRPLKVETDRPLKIETDRPLKVEDVGYTPSRKPGE